MRALRSWIVPILLALGFVALATRVPLIIAVAEPEDQGIPKACITGDDAFRDALQRAPAKVTVDGVALSDCLGRSSDSGQVQSLGASLVNVATSLSARAQAEPGSREALELGYLVGAVRRGSARTQGIWTTVRERIDQESTGLEQRSARYRRGLSAGRTIG
jgi:hypothetical protein